MKWDESMRGVAVLMMFLTVCAPHVFAAEAPIPAALNPSLRQSSSYQDYVKRPKSELSKLLYLVSRLKKTDMKVIYKGREYKMQRLAVIVTCFIAKSYKNENAEKWISVHAYRTKSDGSLIYIKYPDGKLRLAKDFLIEELRTLPA